MKLEIINPHGFCAGVTNALRLAQSLDGVYCLHEIVHNELVVSSLKARGFKFVEDIREVPDGEMVLFSAHGVSPAVRKIAKEKNLKVVDATCPFVSKVHREALRYASMGLPVVVIGKSSHAEVKGIVGEVEASVCGVVTSPRLLDGIEKGARIGVVSQTTMNSDEVKKIVEGLKKYYKVETMAEVCGATRERQDAVRKFCRKAYDGKSKIAVLVLGSVNSSNTRRLAEIAEEEGALTYRAGNIEEVKALNFADIEIFGITSGASTPESFFVEATDYIKGIL
jgi:4-hydroxy-3-methylbut-2-enyl diphosphate reductase